MPEETVEAKPSPVGQNHSLPPEKPHPTRSPVFRVLVWLLILLGFGILFWVVLHHKATAAPKPTGRRAAMGGTVTVTTATAKTGDIGVYQESIGTVTPVYTATITAQASGRVDQVNYREGQTVHQGQTLIQIDPRIYAAQVLSSQGTLAHDTGLLEQAKMDLERYQAAWARNAIPKQTLDDQEKLVVQYEGTVKADQGTLAYNQVQLSYCTITAPFTGRVGLRLVDPGNVVQANSTTQLVVLTQLQPITVVFTIPQDSVTEIQQQMRTGAALAVDAYDRSGQTKIASGKLLTTDNLIDTTTGTLKLRAVFDNRDNSLFPNLFVNARLLVRTLHHVTLIPSSVIQHNADTAFVYLITDGTAHIHNIKPGVENQGTTEVQGLNPGDVVADSSFEKLQDGSKVVIAKHAILPPSNVPGNLAP